MYNTSQAAFCIDRASKVKARSVPRFSCSEREVAWSATAPPCALLWLVTTSCDGLIRPTGRRNTEYKWYFT